MRKILVLAGLTAALGFFAPLAAQAAVIAPVSASVAVQGDAKIHLAGGGKHYNRGHGYHHVRPHHHRPPKVVYHRNYRPWSHWQPHVVHHYSYHSFGAPVYYHAHPVYGDYYHVRARDRNNVALWLGISAITGAILFSSY